MTRDVCVNVSLQIPCTCVAANCYFREFKHADNSVVLTRLVDLGDRHCFARTLCNSRRASRASCDFPLSLFLFLFVFFFLFFLAMFPSDFCTIDYHDFLRKLHRNRAVVSPSEAIYVWWCRGNSDARNTRCVNEPFIPSSLLRIHVSRKL